MFRWGRKPLLGENELEIYNQMMDMRAEKLRVTRSKVFRIAVDLAAEKGILNFKASSKWINGFFHRYKLSLRRQSSLQSVSDEQIVERSVSFMRFLQHMV